MSPTARTLARLRADGYLAAVCERWLPAVQRKADLFGIADVVAVRPAEPRVLLVQATTSGHVADRLARIQARPELPPLLAAGVAVEVWGWSLREGRWHVRRVAVEAPDVVRVVEAPPRRKRPGKGSRQGTLFDEGGASPTPG